MKFRQLLSRRLFALPELRRSSSRLQTVYISDKIARYLPLCVCFPQKVIYSTMSCSKANSILTSVQIAKHGKNLAVRSKEGDATYHPTWLRHNCQCSSCLSYGQKTFDLSEITPSLTIESAHFSGDQLEIVWSSGHHGFIGLEWLRNVRNLAEDNREESSSPPIASELPVLSASGLFEDKEKQWKWLHYLNEFGVCLLTDYGTENEKIKELAQRTMFAIRPTFYGEVYNVEAKKDSISIAQTTQRLKLHKDFEFYDSPPGLQLLHCLRFDDCVEGGESIVLDMFAVVEELRDKWPEHFHTLTRVPATFQRIHYETNQPMDMMFKSPHIQLDSQGRVIEMRWCPPAEGPLNVPEGDVEPYYAAYHCLVEMLNNSKLKLYHRLRPGEVITLNNRRMLHSRNEFMLNGGQRHLQGTFADINHFKSAYRVLCKQLNKGDVSLRQVFSFVGKC